MPRLKEHKAALLEVSQTRMGTGGVEGKAVSFALADLHPSGALYDRRLRRPDR
ncbi:MAG: hypothetical protein ACREX4_07175 [Gammaproteobacteria bacterium]